MTSPIPPAMDPISKQVPPDCASSAAAVVRIKSEDLFQKMREVEIDHHGRIYRLRLTQLNKLILTA